MTSSQTYKIVDELCLLRFVVPMLMFHYEALRKTKGNDKVTGPQLGIKMTGPLKKVTEFLNYGLCCW